MDSNGDSIWVRIFDYSGHADGGCDIKVDILGNVYVNGYTTTSDSSYMTIIKYSGSGNQQWIEYSNGSPTNYKRSLSINNVFDAKQQVIIMFQVLIRIILLSSTPN